MHGYSLCVPGQEPNPRFQGLYILAVTAAHLSRPPAVTKENPNWSLLYIFKKVYMYVVLLYS